MVRRRVRIRFSKSGMLRYLGHRDFVRAIERLLRRAGVVPAMTEGFHPKPKMSFPLALAVGIEGWDEILELELRGFLNPSTMDAKTPAVDSVKSSEIVETVEMSGIRDDYPSFAGELLRRTGREPIQNLVFHTVTELTPEIKKSLIQKAVYRIEIPRTLLAEIQPKLTEILASESWPMERENRSPVDLRRSLVSVTFADISATGVSAESSVSAKFSQEAASSRNESSQKMDGDAGNVATDGMGDQSSKLDVTVELTMRFAVTTGADAGPRELLTALGIAGVEVDGAILSRVALELDPVTDERIAA